MAQMGTGAVGKLEGKRPLGRRRCRWEGNMKKDLQQIDERALTELVWLMQEQVAGCCECGNEPSGSTKCGEFLDQLRTCQLLRKDYALWGQIVTQIMFGIPQKYKPNVLSCHVKFNISLFSTRFCRVRMRKVRFAFWIRVSPTSTAASMLAHFFKLRSKVLMLYIKLKAAGIQKRHVFMYAYLTADA